MLLLIAPCRTRRFSFSFSSHIFPLPLEHIPPVWVFFFVLFFFSMRIPQGKRFLSLLLLVKTGGRIIETAFLFPPPPRFLSRSRRRNTGLFSPLFLKTASVDILSLPPFRQSIERLRRVSSPFRPYSFEAVAGKGVPLL